MEEAKHSIRKSSVILMTINICLASLYFGYNIATYNSLEQVFQTINGWRGTSSENLYPPILTSSLALGCVIFAPIATHVLKIFKGNLRKASIIMDILVLVATFIQVVDKNIVNLIIGRFLAGAIIGLNCTYVSTYIAEISPVSMRGVMGSMNQLFICSGICIVFLLGLILPNKIQLTTPGYIYDNEVDWRIVLGFPVVFGVIRLIMLLLVFTHDTPSTLIKEKRYGDLNTFLEFIYKSPVEIENARKQLEVEYTAELTKVSSTATVAPPQNEEEMNNMKQQNSSDLESQNSNDNIAFSFYEKNSYSRRWLLGLLMCIGQQLTCINGVMFYSNRIFEKTSSPENARYFSLGLGFIQMFATLVGAVMSDRFGRRPLMIAGTSVMVVSLGLVAVFVSIEDKIFCFLSISLFLIAFSVSQGPLVWAYQGQMLDKKALQVNTCVLWFFTLVIGIIFPYLDEYLGIGFTFGIFAVITLAFLLYFFKEFQEIKGKTRLQIYQSFCKEKFIPLANKVTTTSQ